ncbi:MAG TPA: aldo/keto reductase [Bryobacteraceae bacterium]|nr:aldo/keto reductase [Bryobacteraceae bacterium]
MQTTTLRDTDLTVSRACFGTMTFGAQTDEAAARRMIDTCLDRGVNFLDTANVYNKGASETMLGKLLKSRRGRVVLASKVRGKMGDAADESGLSRAAILKAIDQTLLRLDTDYLDLYYLHQPDWSIPIEETLGVMDELVRAGKVRYPASSNYAAWQVAEMISISQQRNYRAPLVSQPMYNLLARGIEQEYTAMAKRFDVFMVVYNPLAGGLLTGKQQRDRPLPGTRFDNNQMYLDRYWHPTFFDAVDELTAAAARAGRSLIDTSLSWLLHHTTTDCVILGASKPEHLEQNLDAVENSRPLPAELLSTIDAVWTKLRGVTPKYNR